MKQPTETVCVGFASREDAIEARLRTVTGPFTIVVEPAEDYPGQELAIDVYAASRDALASAVDQITTILADEFGLSSKTTTEIDLAS